MTELSRSIEVERNTHFMCASEAVLMMFILIQISLQQRDGFIYTFANNDLNLKAISALEYKDSEQVFPKATEEIRWHSAGGYSSHALY